MKKVMYEKNRSRPLLASSSRTNKATVLGLVPIKRYLFVDAVSCVFFKNPLKKPELNSVKVGIPLMLLG